jgi:hypothetical protein
MAPEVKAPATMCLISLAVFMSFPLSVAAPEATKLIMVAGI